MNHRRVLRIVGLVLYVLAGAQTIPLLWCLHPYDAAAVLGFLTGAGVSAACGFACRLVAPTDRELYRREGVLIVVGSWLIASLSGAIPYVASGAIPGLVDALFESASGFTTTGASILTDIESLPRSILFWRSMTQWLGGIGIVVLFVALLSELGPGARFLFKLEVPGPKAEILHARVQSTAAALFRVYLVLTLAQTAIMLALGASLYDALVHAFSTVSTGGFSPYNDSVAHFSHALQGVILVFMLAAGVNFSLYYALSRTRSLRSMRDVELGAYLAIAAAASGAVAFDIHLAGKTDSIGVALLESSFQVVSLLTTTGFATADFASWPGFAQAVLLSLMFVGGCAGSTAGGIKIVRVIIGWRVAMREVRLIFSPNTVMVVAIGGRPVPEESLRGVVALILLWILGWGIGSLLLSVGDFDVLTAATASLATVSNIGPGLVAVGPTGNFAFFEPWQKLVMTVLMWLGRLEFFAVLALLQPHFWRR